MCEKSTMTNVRNFLQEIVPLVQFLLVDECQQLANLFNFTEHEIATNLTIFISRVHLLEIANTKGKGDIEEIVEELRAEVAASGFQFEPHTSVTHLGPGDVLDQLEIMYNYRIQGMLKSKENGSENMWRRIDLLCSKRAPKPAHSLKKHAIQAYRNVLGDNLESLTVHHWHTSAADHCLQEQLLGYHRTPVHVTGDGSCLYHALAATYCDACLTAKELKRILADQFVAIQDAKPMPPKVPEIQTFGQELVAMSPGVATCKELENNIRFGNAWGDCAAVAVASVYFARPIVVVRGGHTSYENRVSVHHLPGQENNARKGPIVLGIVENHYWATAPI
jgi:hypothetical protein